VLSVVGEEEWLVAIALLSWYYAIVGYGLVWSVEHCCPGNARACLDGVIIEVASSSEPIGGEALPREHVRGLEGW
jgi:hypothetical protein